MDEYAPDLFQSAFQCINEGVLIVDHNGIVIFTNDAYDAGPREEVLGKELLSVRPGAKLLEVMKTRTMQKCVLRQNGDFQYVVNMYPIINEKDELLGGISIGSSLSKSLHNAAQLLQFQTRLNTLKSQLHSAWTANTTFDDIISQDMNSLTVKKVAQKAAKSDIDVLLLGESGVGKEMYAQAIHNASPRKDKPFIAVNSATFQGSLLESELFGYEGGTFTGGRSGGKIGLIESANGGTLFLDEISELDYSLQAKLLRVLQERTVRKVGGTKEIPVDVRLISASNVELESRVNKGLFRKDLYYRIAAFPLSIPPLRNRPNDILPLARKFLQHHENKVKRRIDLADEVKEIFFHFKWDGNVRQLKNAIDYATTMMDGFTIRKMDLPVWLMSSILDDYQPTTSLKSRIQAFELQEIKKAVYYFGDDVDGKRKAAESLGISLSTLYAKLQSTPNDCGSSPE